MYWQEFILRFRDAALVVKVEQDYILEKKSE